MAVKNIDYFTTSETSQRLDLIRHLIQNSEIVPLIRGPSGIGKSLLAARIQQLAPESWSVCLFQASATLSPDQLLAYIARCSGWTDMQEDPLQGLVERFESMRERGLVPVILVDDAHLLPPTGLITLLRLFERQRAGEPLVSVVLFADEQIDMLLSTPQLQIMTPQSIQVIDLQPWNREDATSFMHFLLQVESLPADLELESSRLTKLYRETKGIPGLLRQAILNAIGDRGEGQVSKARAIPKAIYIAIPILILVGGVLFFQDTINRLFQSPETGIEPLPVEPQTPKQVERVIEQELKQQENQEAVQPQQALEQTPDEQLVDAKLIEDNIEKTASYAVVAVEESDPSTESAQAADVKPETLEESFAKKGFSTDSILRQGEPLSLSSGPVHKPEPISEPPPEPEALEHPQQLVATAPPKIAEEVGSLLDQVVKTQEPIDPLHKEEWVRTRPAEHYTLQLLGVESLTSLKRFVLRHGLKGELFYIQTQRNGKPWYPLLWGEFPDKLSAIDAQQGLPPSVRRNGIWPRPYGELQKLLK